MDYFFSEEITKNQKFFTLKNDEAHHCINVLRKKIGDFIKIINGKGTVFTVKIVNIFKDACELEIIDYEDKEKLFNIHIAISPTKNIDRFEWFIEKSTEIGVDIITPIICKRSERRNVKIERLEKLIVAAVKQSGRYYKPRINSLITFDKFLIQNKNDKSLKLIAHCYDTPKKRLNDIKIDNNEVTILIGPEGDFSEEEIKFAIANDYISITLGENRLRTETAGIVACNIIKFILENNYSTL